MKTGTFVIILSLICILFAAGCSNTARFNYSEAYGAVPALMPLPGDPSVGVLPAEDFRDADTYALNDNANEGVGSYYFGFLPLMPFGWRTMRHPEQSGSFATLSQFDFNPAEDLANAASIGLKASRLFSKVERVRDIKNCSSTYLWRTRLRNSNYRGHLITYGVTYFAAPVLWLIGLPDGLSVAKLHIDFELIDRASNKTVWSCSSNLSDSQWHWLYARIGTDADLYAKMMKYALARAAVDLSQKYPQPASAK